MCYADDSIIRLLDKLIKEHPLINSLALFSPYNLDNILSNPKITSIKIQGRIDVDSSEGRPSFQKFINAVEKNQNITKLEILGGICFFGFFSFVKEMQSFIQALKANRKLQTLSLLNINWSTFDQKAFAEFCNYIQENTVLLALSLNFIDYFKLKEEHWHLIFSSIASNQSLRQLSFNGSDFHSVSDNVFKIFLEFVAENRRITTLDLSCCKLEKWPEKRFESFIESLQQNSTVRHFICNIPFGEKTDRIFKERFALIQRLIAKNNQSNVNASMGSNITDRTDSDKITKFDNPAGSDTDRFDDSGVFDRTGRSCGDRKASLEMSVVSLSLESQSLDSPALERFPNIDSSEPILFMRKRSALSLRTIKTKNVLPQELPEKAPDKELDLDLELELESETLDKADEKSLLL